jgi:hypothetical protein
MLSPVAPLPRPSAWKIRGITIGMASDWASSSHLTISQLLLNKLSRSENTELQTTSESFIKD